MLIYKCGLQHEKLHVQKGTESVRNFLSAQLFQAVGGQSHALKSQSPVINTTCHLLIVSELGPAPTYCWKWSCLRHVCAYIPKCLMSLWSTSKDEFFGKLQVGMLHSSL